MVKKEEVEYAWPYLKDTGFRGKVLYDTISPFIGDCRSVLDFNCGFAPLYPYLKGLNYCGFDINGGCIDYLKETYPGGRWIQRNDKVFNVALEVDLLLYLGISDGTNKIDSPVQAESVIRLVKKYRPSVVVLETSERVGMASWLRMAEFLWDDFRQAIPLTGLDTDLKVNSDRLVEVHVRKNN